MGDLGRARARPCVSGGAKANLRRVADYGLRGSLTFHRLKVPVAREACRKDRRSQKSDARSQNAESQARTQGGERRRARAKGSS